MTSRPLRETTTATRRLAIFLVAFLAVAMTASLAHAQTGSVEQSESIEAHVGDWLSVSSTRDSLQLVEIKGNLSLAMFSSPQHYPASSFNLTSNAQSHYSIRLVFDYASEYDVGAIVKESSGVDREVASYYVSSGQLLLTIDVDFRTPDSVSPTKSSSVWDDFTSWTTRFGDAFPFWVKILYVILGAQFLAVGYKWIKFENTARADNSSVSKFDRGNLLYLWTEILYKFLLTAFLMIAAIMSGQFLLLSVLKFMFLAQVNMLNLWDLFVLGFAAGMATISYIFRLCLEKSLDLKPLFQD
jgi:hypothetical protein